MGVAELFDGLRHHLDPQTGGVVVDAAGEAGGAHAGIQVGEDAVLGDEDIGGDGEDDAVGALALAVLRHSHAIRSGKGGAAEKDRDAAFGHLDDLVDDGLFFLQGKKGHFACAAKDKQLGGAVLDLAVDEHLKGAKINLVLMVKGGGHCDPGTGRVNHNQSPHV